MRPFRLIDHCVSCLCRLTQQLQFIEALQRQALNDFVFAEAGGTSGADSLTQEQKLQLIGASRLEAAMADAQRSSSDGASTTQQQRPAVQSQDYEDDDYFGANVEYYDIYYDDYYADDYFYG